MTNAKNVEAFIRAALNAYGLELSYLLPYYGDEEDEAVGEPGEWKIVEDGRLVMPVVERCAMMLGVDVEDLLDQNADAVMKWYEKYPYFRHREEMEVLRMASFQSEEAKIQWLFSAIFDDEVTVPTKPTRFDTQDVLRRMNELRALFGKPAAELTDAEGRRLCIRTEAFFRYKRIGEAVRSWLDMAHRLEELFFAMVENGGLYAEEEEEYNFLVSVFDAKDIVQPNWGRLYYDLMEQCAPVYRSEAYKEFGSYVKLGRAGLFRPWQCADFSEDPALVQEYVNTFPWAKAEMRRFWMEVSHFVCEYRWGAAVRDHAEDLLYGLFGEREEEREPNYVPKTKEELAGDEAAMERLRRLTGRQKNGGVAVPEPEIVPYGALLAPGDYTSRLNARMGICGPMQQGGAQG